MLRTCSNLLKNVATRHIAVRSMTHYPIDDVMFGLNEEQTAVSYQIALSHYHSYQPTIVI